MSSKSKRRQPQVTMRMATRGALTMFLWAYCQVHDPDTEQMEAMSHPNPEMLGTGQNSNKTADELFKMALPQEVEVDWYAIEEPWTLRHNTYSAAPEGDSVEMAKKALQLMTEILSQ